MAVRGFPAVFGLLLLCICSALVCKTAAKRPKCVPVDWTQTSDFLDFGSCNWPSDQSPCGNVVPRAGFKPGQRAWPFGLCTLKFSRKPWNPDVYSYEADKTWHCGAKYYYCWQGDNKSSGYACGGDSAGTDTLCPDIRGTNWKCEARNRTYENSNCQGDHDLVLDVSSMGFPPELKTARVSNPQQCAEMCALRSTCNIWNFCNSPEGCGWTCQGYVWTLHPPKKGLSLGAILGIVFASVFVMLTAAGLTAYFCIRKKRERLRAHHKLNPSPSAPSHSPSSDQQSASTPPSSLPPHPPLSKPHPGAHGRVMLTRLEIPGTPPQPLTPANSYQLGRYSPRSSPGGLSQGPLQSGRTSPSRASGGYCSWAGTGHPQSAANWDELAQQHSHSHSHSQSHSPYRNQPSPTQMHQPLFQGGVYSTGVTPYGEGERRHAGHRFDVQRGRSPQRNSPVESTHISMAILPHTEGSGVIEAGRRQPVVLTRMGRNGADHAMW